jgi:hypothetical protein
MVSKEEWIEALRSGNYEQTQGALRKDDKFCCLGVLCDISGEGEWASESDDDGEIGYVVPIERVGTQEDLYGFHSSKDTVTFFGTLPLFIREEMNLNLIEVVKLAGFNDSGYTFEDIADKIESENYDD